MHETSATGEVCLTIRDRSSVGCLQGPGAQGFTCDGYYFQEYVVVDARSAVKLPPSLDVAASAPLCCAGVTAYNAIKDCQLTSGKWLAIVGAGHVGQMGIQYAKAMKLKVVAVDINEDRLNAAKMVGADYTFNPEICPKYADDIKTITRLGVDAAVHFAPAEEAYGDMPSMIRWSGILMVVEASHGPLINESLDPYFKKYVIKTVCNGTSKSLEECVAFSASHNIKPRVRFIKLEDLPQTLETMEAGKLRERVCVKF